MNPGMPGSTVMREGSDIALADGRPRGLPDESGAQSAVVNSSAAENAGGMAADTDDFLTRPEVADALGVSIATVRRLQGKQLHPTRSEDGIYLFTRGEVEALRTLRPPPPPTRGETLDPGDLASEAFKLLRDGVEARDIVIALRRTPEEIEALQVAWERMGGALFISEKVRGQLQVLANQRRLPIEILDAIENDDSDSLRSYVRRKAASARRDPARENVP